MNGLRNSENIGLIMNEISKNRDLFKFVITYIRSLDVLKIYSNEKIDPLFNNLMKKFDLEKDFHPIKTGADGNCFYRACSFILFSTEEYFFVIKFCCIFLFNEYKNCFYYFLSITEDKQNIEDQPFSKKMKYYLRDNTYADECSYILTAILIDRPIINIILHEKTVFVQKYCSKENFRKAPIYTAFLKNHMVSILTESHDTKESKLDIRDENNNINRNKELCILNDLLNFEEFKIIHY
jgi:hypothetical protein